MEVAVLTCSLLRMQVKGKDDSGNQAWFRAGRGAAERLTKARPGFRAPE